MLYADFFHLFYPDLCEACSSALFRNEKVICLRCRNKLPYTGYHRFQENRVERLFWGRVPLVRATSFLFFNKGNRVQQLMHALKYRKRPEIGILLGELFFLELKDSTWLDDIDGLVAVPLHPGKEAVRGYNQSEVFARGLSKASGIPVEYGLLQRRKNTESQTRKSRMERWENVEEVFECHSGKDLAGKHLLLLDDIVTTGATLEACAAVLRESCQVRVSIATLACTFT